MIANDFSSSNLMTPLSVVQYLAMRPREFLELSESIWNNIQRADGFKEWKQLRKRHNPLRHFMKPLYIALRRMIDSETFTLNELLRRIDRLSPRTTFSDSVRVSTGTVFCIYEKLMTNKEKRHTNIWKLGSIVTSMCLLIEQEEVNEQSIKKWGETIVRFGVALSERYLKDRVQWQKKKNDVGKHAKMCFVRKTAKNIVRLAPSSTANSPVSTSASSESTTAAPSPTMI